MRVTWISGWGIAPESLRTLAEQRFPNSEHTFLAPTVVAASRESAANHGENMTAPCRDAATDLTIAWSLGAWRVIEAASRGVEIPGMVLLLAPFVAFPSEAGLGGKCSATQVKVLRRWLQREPLAALADFYQRAGLARSAPLPGRCNASSTKESETPATGALREAELPYPMPELIEGLDRLAEDAPPGLREFAARGLPRNWQAFVGEDDPLLDAEAVCRSLPGCIRLPRVGHAIADLLAASQAR